MIEITSFRKFHKNTLRGFCNILLTNIGLEIRDATLHEKNGKRWIGLPAKPYQDENGDTKYSYIVKFPEPCTPRCVNGTGNSRTQSVRDAGSYRHVNQTIGDKILAMVA